MLPLRPCTRHVETLPKQIDKEDDNNQKRAGGAVPKGNTLNGGLTVAFPRALTSMYSMCYA
jgi:hypothetical protein